MGLKNMCLFILLLFTECNSNNASEVIQRILVKVSYIQH